MCKSSLVPLAFTRRSAALTTQLCSVQFLFQETGTSGHFDQFGRLVMKGRFLSRQIERVMGRYEGMYGEYLRCCGWFIQRTDGLGVVVCKECVSRDTTLRQGERWQVFVKVCTI
jgi:translation initiation factor 2 beta subunit (eIF-2beta)/eIF-5